MRNISSNFLAWLLFLAIGMFTVSCGQLSSLQTGKALGKNKVSIGGALWAYSVDNNNSGNGDLGSGVFPYGEIFGRFGLTDKLDVGVKLSAVGNILVDGKFQILGNETSKFAAALGAGFELQATRFSEVLVYRTHLPLYLSFHPNQKTAFYLTPRLAFQKVSNGSDTFFPGVSVGLENKFSSKFRLYVEGSYYRPSSETISYSRNNFYLFGAGCAFIFQ